MELPQRMAEATLTYFCQLKCSGLERRRGERGGGMAVYKINEKGVLVVCLEISRSLSFHYKIIKFQNQVKFGILNNTSKKAPFASPKSGP